MARDKRFIIALLIIVLLLGILFYVLFVGPRFQGYVTKKQLDAQQTVVNAMIDIATSQGYVTLTDGNRSIILVKYDPEQFKASSDSLQEVSVNTVNP